MGHMTSQCAGKTSPAAGLDKALADSFPASDPPFWTLGLPKHEESDAPEDAGARPGRYLEDKPEA